MTSAGRRGELLTRFGGAAFEVFWQTLAVAPFVGIVALGDVRRLVLQQVMDADGQLTGRGRATRSGTPSRPTYWKMAVTFAPCRNSAGPQGREHDDDLHARAEPRWAWRAQPA